jgi:hypothetical protein
MRSKTLRFAPALLFTFLLLPLSNTGCAVRAEYRVYDPYYHDYHVWNDRESASYRQWAVQNHRENVDFRKLNKNDQKQYWDWRHSHPDHE